ncbi:DUF2220 family protein [Marinobacter oulmenensis]|uniref:Wadjet protein JetD C-terminal domain-containing protein n=1 Tax=Marinobacter oulmenensis TaxID=643747 RepID=A0A840U6E8_9GAMM|nr:DUF2220 family protein [Marinobacter oulmenensis]MBB5321314.1 hypothetical protein [Marinobacter oulmenensis]
MDNYLRKILNGVPINYEAFLKRLPKRFRNRQRDIFTACKVSANRWVVTIDDESAFADLLHLAEAPVDRVDAAKKGNSHRQGTGVSFVLAYHRRLRSPRPDVVVITGESVDIGFQPASRVLVVENEQNFYRYVQTLTYVSRMLGQHLNLTDCDVVFGAGNRITRGVVLDWLAGYQEVLCAFDYDAGGLQMFSTISARLGESAHFVQPDDWSPWLESFLRVPDSTDRYVTALRLADSLGFVNLAKAFRSTGKFMEQEVLLAN